MNHIFVPIKPKKISEEIVEQVKELVFSGKLAPGEKLPSERELAKSLSVSRVSLREALNTLQAMGLLEIQQGNRTFVRPMTTLSIYNPLVAFSVNSNSNVLKLFEVRKYLEIGSVALAAERATRQEIKLLEKILKVMKEDLEKGRLGAKADLDFHATIAAATHNQAYFHIMCTIHDLLQEKLRNAWGGVFKKKDRRKKLFDQHQTICKAIEEHDVQRATEATAIHFNYVQEAWKNSLSKETANPLINSETT